MAVCTGVRGLVGDGGTLPVTTSDDGATSQGRNTPSLRVGRFFSLKVLKPHLELSQRTATPSVSHEKCSRQAETWTRVSPSAPARKPAHRARRYRPLRDVAAGFRGASCAPESADDE